MALLFTQKASIEDVVFDVAESETHKASARVTDHPVETGATISDHIVQEPDTLDLVARVSNTPIATEEELATLSPFRAEEAYRKLLELKQSGELVDCVTSLREYTEMAIILVAVSRDSSTGQVVALQLSLRHVRTATSELVAAPVTSVPRAQQKLEQGKKATDPAPDPLADQSSTLLLELGRKVSSNITTLTGG